MCFDLDALPPVPPLSGAAVSHSDIVLETADGNRFAAFEAVPDDATGAGIVVLPDVRGLYRFYEELALRFAEAGHRAVAIDYYGRTAGIGKRDDEFPYMDHFGQTASDTIQQDVAAAVAHLRPSCEDVYTVGFCAGGRASWIAAASGHGLAGAAGFYGSLAPRAGSPSPIELAPRMEAPILALQAGADKNITPEQNADFADALTAAGVSHEMVIYEGAPHSFFDRTQAEHAEASADAWRRVLDFVS